MNLSRSRRLALFDSPVEVTRSYTVKKRGKSTEFRQFSIPPFEYEVSFRAAPGESYIVSFALTDIRAEGEELASILSRILGREISVRQAPLVKRQFNPTGVLNTGNASQVLAAVVRIIREFVEERKPSCLALNALEKSRRDLYRRMVRSIARGAQVEETRYGFQICFPPEMIEKRKTALRLTSSYRTVTALFDTEVEYGEDRISRPGRLTFSFNLPPFSYSVLFLTNKQDPGVVDVSFGVDPNSLREEELRAYFAEKWGRPLPPHSPELEDFFDRAIEDPLGVLGTGQASRVFSQVIRVIRDFLGQNPQIRCLTLRAEPRSRVDLYEALVRRFFPGSRVTLREERSETYFQVCRPEGGAS